MNYYNENDPAAAEWLRELIRAGLIPPGDVDQRSITNVSPDDLKPYIQCHFFAGIGGWSLALQLAGWPATRPVWSGSCPCQPFSSAGKQLGASDERHRWPVFFNLIRECRPDVVFGEQVAAAIGKGWLDGIRADLEGADYACGAAVLGAHSVGAPHKRQRLYWVADAGHRDHRSEGRSKSTGRREPCGTGRSVANANRSGPQPGREPAKINGHGSSALSNGSNRGLDHAQQPRLEGHAGHGDGADEPGRLDPLPVGPTAEASGAGHWSRFDLIPCADGKSRRIKPGLAPLVDGLPRGVVPSCDPGAPGYAEATAEARKIRLRGYGNAIVPQLAAEFIGAYLDSCT